ncbi:hypothetical protein V496_03207 [Pseudogymnoascus sp. VKM F-4515 (FW-2607)]|nr:hypothetical protein V496_03207 [Pseudogymnoascus sp. VKM F-4515 (FW-2607)]KFY96531.1 hypothetical protein V498_02627 [Pseudogymnoascus sp. VKM F-4517 (FW-2822)]
MTPKKSRKRHNRPSRPVPVPVSKEIITCRRTITPQSQPQPQPQSQPQAQSKPQSPGHVEPKSKNVNPVAKSQRKVITKAGTSASNWMVRVLVPVLIEVPKISMAILFLYALWINWVLASSK